MSEPLEGEVLGPEMVVETCDVCGQEFHGPKGGKGSAPMLLGRHRWSVHKIRKDGTTTAAAGKSAPAAEAGAVGLVSVVADAAAGVKGSGPPRAAQLGSALGKILSNVSESAAGWAVKSDPAIKAALDPQTPGQTEEALRFAELQARAITASLSLTEDTARQITAPLGRLLAPTRLNQRFGRVVVENTDLGPAALETFEVLQAWGRFLAVRREHVRELKALRAQLAQQQASVAASAVPAEPGAPLPPPAAVYPDLEGLGSGVIATPQYRTQ